MLFVAGLPWFAPAGLLRFRGALRRARANTRRILALALSAGCCTQDALAAAARRTPEPVAPCPASGTLHVRFGGAPAGDRITLQDGTEVRLAGIAVAEGSQHLLAPILAGRQVTLGFTGAERDRYGRYSAQVFADGLWVQQQLVSAGEAMAAPEVAAAACAPALLAAEEAARSAREGQWRYGRFAVLDVDRLMVEARRRAGTFQIVEGTVLEAAVVRGRAYLNFGADRRTDVTVTIAPEDMRRFRSVRFDPRTLAGARIRVRGWLELFNGPNMQIATPQAIEVLHPAPVSSQEFSP